MCIDKLDDIVHEYNNTYHRTIRMKSIDVKVNTDTGYIYLNILTKGYIPNWREKISIIKKVKSTVPWAYVI